MSQDYSDREIRGSITIDFSHPRVLDGLEYWRDLGLLNDEEIKYLSRKYLICPVLEMATVKVPAVRNASFTEELIPEPQPALVTTEPNFLSLFWRSFRAELSVRWLLFLGLFLVTLSSTVLAGTQWNNISNLGQYGVLLFYSLVFYAVGNWASHQENLGLTAQTLQGVFILLIPINIWAMDTFYIWRSSGGIILAILSIITLFYLFYRQNTFQPIANLFFLLISLLQLGWQVNNVSLIAVYSGIIGATWLLGLGRNNSRLTSKFAIRLVLYAVATLLIRVIFIRQLPLSQLGLALALLGWLTPYYWEIENRDEENRLSKPLFNWGAIFLLGLAWWITWGNSSPLQSVGVSLLVIHFFYRRLRSAWQPIDILFLFASGLESLFRWRDLVPVNWREATVNLWLNLTQSASYFPNLYGLTLFPYVIIWLTFSGWLRRREKIGLANLADYLCLGLGIVLTLISLTNLWGRSFNFFLSTLALVYSLAGRRESKFILYLCHGLALLTVASFIDAIYPQLNTFSWALIVVAATVVELLSSLFESDKPLRQSFGNSAWFFGLLLAGISYTLFFSLTRDVYFQNLWWLLIEITLLGANPYSGYISFDNLWWLLVPTTLTFVGALKEGNRRSEAIKASCYGLIFAIALTFWQSPLRLIGFAISSVVMAANTYYLPRLSTSRLHIGFLVATVIFAVREYGFKTLSIWQLYTRGDWLLFQCLLLSVLLLVSLPLKARANLFASFTGRAAYEWGMGLWVWNTLRLTLHCAGVISGLVNPAAQWWLSPLFLAGILIYTHRSRLNNFVVWGLVWLGEILIVEIFWRGGESFLLMAGVNLIVGWLGLLVGGMLLNRLSHLSSIKSFPLFYGLIGILARVSSFNAYTGGVTILASLLAAGVSRRFEGGKSLTILSLIGVSLGLYEGVFYAASKSSDSNIANFFLLLSVVSVGIAITHRLLLGWYESLFYLSVAEVKAIAHTYWLLSLPLKLGGILSFYPSPYLLFLTLLTSAYSWWEGFISRRDNWVYWGGVDFFFTLVIFRLTYPFLGVYDWLYGMAAALVAFCLYNLPWESWGWYPLPWRRMALFLPLVTALFTSLTISYPSLAFIALFYAYVSIKPDKIRWSYLSLGFFNWMLVKFLVENNFRDIFYWGSMLGLSILYIAAVDPILKQRREQRHSWRVGGSGLICLTALLFHQGAAGLLPASIGLLTLLAGLGLRIRAFLFVGTITFMLTVFYQLIVLSWNYSFLKWAIGLLIGIIMISVAALFERLREQVMTLWNNVLQQLESWD